MGPAICIVPLPVLLVWPAPPEPFLLALSSPTTTVIIITYHQYHHHHHHCNARSLVSVLQLLLLAVLLQVDMPGGGTSAVPWVAAAHQAAEARTERATEVSM